MIEELSWMQGQTYSTLARNKHFQVLDVSPTRIIIHVETTGDYRTITHTELDIAWEHLVRNGSLTQLQVLESGSRSSAYIVAILSKIVGVSYRLSPITLFYGR